MFCNPYFISIIETESAFLSAARISLLHRRRHGSRGPRHQSAKLFSFFTPLGFCKSWKVEIFLFCTFDRLQWFASTIRSGCGTATTRPPGSRPRLMPSISSAVPKLRSVLDSAAGSDFLSYRVLGSDAKLGIGFDFLGYFLYLQSNPENTVGVLTMGGKGVRVLVTPTSDLGKILACMHGKFL